MRALLAAVALAGALVASGAFPRNSGAAESCFLFQNLSDADLGSNPNTFVGWGETCLFVAQTYGSGTGIFRTDGTHTGTQLLRNYVWGDTPPMTDPIAANGTVFFCGRGEIDDQWHEDDLEPWISDGTWAGTHRIRDIRPGPHGSNPQHFCEFSGQVFFSAYTQENGTELWRTDGTDKGTMLVADIIPGSAGSVPSNLTVSGNLLYFVATDEKTGYELWASDGTPGGTAMVVNLTPDDVVYDPPADLTPLGNRLVFSGVDGVTGRELWITDGAPDGTMQLRDIRYGADGSSLRSLTLVGKQVFFVADDGKYGAELWVTDGTADGTQLVDDINPGGYGSNPAQLTAFGDTVVFTATSSETGGNYLYQSDGSARGTQLLVGPDTKPRLGVITEPTVVGEFLCFGAYSEGGYGLWRIGQTPDSLELLSSGTTDFVSLPRELTPAGNLLFFRGHPRNRGAEPFVCDVANADVAMLANLNTQGGSGPTDLVRNGDRLYFTASTPELGRELWKWDVGTSSALPVSDMVPGPGNSTFMSFATLGDRLCFTNQVETTRDALWITDGTDAGTMQVVPDDAASYPGGVQDLATAGDRVYFGAQSAGYGIEPWVTDGTAGGTRMLLDIRPGDLSSDPANFTDVGGLCFFSASTGNAPEGLGVELWVSDGTSDGTRLVRDINESANYNYGSSSPSNFANAGKQLLFRADDGVHGFEPWVSDGTPDGTHLLLDIAKGAESSIDEIVCFAELNGRYYFAAKTDAYTGEKLWVTDLTTEGTRLLTSLPAPFGARPDFGEIVRAGNRLFMRANNGETSLELWTCDGTAEGTRLVGEIVPGPQPSFGPLEMTPVGDRVFFRADDLIHGDELWVSDGRTVEMVRDTWPGPNGSAPVHLAECNGALFFQADDGRNGAELWTTLSAIEVFESRIRDQITRFYLLALERTPSEEESDRSLELYRRAFLMGVDVWYAARAVLGALLGSGDFVAQVGARTNEDFITDCYHALLVRRVSNDEMAAELAELERLAGAAMLGDLAAARRALVLRLIDSEEFRELLAKLLPGLDGDPEPNIIAGIFQGMLGRPVTDDEMTYWGERMASMGDKAWFARLLGYELAGTAEYLRRWKSRTDVTVGVYAAFLNRLPTDGELADVWSMEPSWTLGTVAEQIIDKIGTSNEFYDRLNDLLGDAEADAADAPFPQFPEPAADKITLTPALIAGGFSHPDANATHAASQWQIRPLSSLTDYTQVVFDSAVTPDALTSIEIPPGRLNYNTTYAWRVRYRDNRGVWSEWSLERTFTTDPGSVESVPPRIGANVWPPDGQTGVSLRPRLVAGEFLDSNIGDFQTQAYWSMYTADKQPVLNRLEGPAREWRVPADVLKPATEYVWRVRFFDSRGAWSEWSRETSFTTVDPGKPPAPEDLRVFVGPDSVRLRWRQPYDYSVVGFLIYRSLKSPDGPFDLITDKPVRGDRFLDTGLQRGENYWYRLRAVNMNGELSPLLARAAVVPGSEGIGNVQASAVAGQTRIFMSDMQGEPGQTVSQHVMVTNPNHVTNESFEVNILHDADMLTPSNAAPSALTEGFGLTTATLTAPDRFRISASGGTVQVEGEGPLFEASWDVAGDAEYWTQSTLSFGNVKMMDNGEPPSPLDMDVTSTASITVAAAIVPGDLNGDDLVTPADELLLAQIVLGLRGPSEREERAGDLNGDGVLDSADQALLRRLIVQGSTGGSGEPPQKWVLEWGAQQYTIDNIEAPIVAANLEGVAGVDLVIHYDPEDLQITGILQGEAAEPFDVWQTDTPDGRIHILAASDTASDPTGEFAVLQFLPLGDWEETTLYVMQVQLSDAAGNDLSVTGSVTFEDCVLVRGAGLPTPMPTPTEPSTATPTPVPTPTPDCEGIECVVLHFYAEILDRVPAQQEIDGWAIGYFEWLMTEDLDVRFVPSEMGRQFFLSAEYEARASDGPTFVTDCYNAFLYRNPSQGELDGWGTPANRKETISVFANSAEFQERIVEMFPDMDGDPTRNFVATMYLGLLDRLPDPGGLGFYAGEFDAAGDKRARSKQMGAEVSAAQEYAEKRTTDELRVESMYRAYLGRYPNDSETDYWTGELEAGGITLDDMIDAFADSQEFTDRLDAYFP